mmetsp:Transcript_25614/g.48508  ORF Transcript_25614/g.48508 Transcript_25614/m.48508 type:complete len:210 (-) Transcript_25614:236-865(-)
MDLGDQNAAGLALCSKYTDAQVNHVAACAAEAVMGRGAASDLLAAGDASSINSAQHRQEMYSAIACTLVEASKMDSTDEDLRVLLTNEHHMKGSQAKAITAVFAAHKAELRQLLARSSASSPVPRLVDTHWRMDLDVAHSKDRVMGKKPRYHFTLETQPSTTQEFGGTTEHPSANAGKELRLVLTEEQLQDMLVRLREACRAVEVAQAQ